MPASIGLFGQQGQGASNTLVLRGLDEVEHPGVVCELYDGLVRLPAFVPELAPTPPEVDSCNHIATQN